jgi:saccharopine dehydrogenase-like NADP-dependent oxidoreductase
MKVLCLGGSGGMGRYATKAIADFEELEAITIADLNKDAAEEFAKSFDAKVQGIGLDVTDTKNLAEALKRHDLVLNTTGPFFMFGVPILKAAIENNCHYIDICDDWEPTEEMLKLDSHAKDVGISAIIGLGASPGITNLMGLVAMEELDSVDTVITGWDLSSVNPAEESSQTGTNAAMIHGIQQMTGKVKIFEDGQLSMVQSLKELKINYPGKGIYKANIFGHPEAISFPYHFPTIKNSFNVAHGSKKIDIFIIKIILWLSEKNIISQDKAANIFHWLETQTNRPSFSSKKAGLPAIYGLAHGIKNGSAASVGVTFSANNLEKEVSMGEATGHPLALGLKLFLQGKINKPGVFAPEGGVIDAQDFFNAYAELEGLEKGLDISRSWEI